VSYPVVEGKPEKEGKVKKQTPNKIVDKERRPNRRNREQHFTELTYLLKRSISKTLRIIGRKGRWDE